MIFHPTYTMVNTKILGGLNDASDPISAKTYLAAYGLGSSTVSLILLAPCVTFCLGLNNLIPQAFGAQNYKLCGAYLNRMLIVSTMIFSPFLVPIMFLERVYLKLNNSEEVSYLAAKYA